MTPYSTEATAALRVVAALIVNDEGSVLISLRPTGEPRGGLWEFPGGKVEDDESDEMALRREILEELGVEIRVGALFHRVMHRYPDLTIDLLAYMAKISSGVPEAIQSQEVRWVPLEDLRLLEFPEADISLVDKLCLLNRDRYAAR